MDLAAEVANPVGEGVEDQSEAAHGVSEHLAHHALAARRDARVDLSPHPGHRDVPVVVVAELAPEHGFPEGVVDALAAVASEPLVGCDALVLPPVLLSLEVQGGQSEAYAVGQAERLELEEVEGGDEVVDPAVVQRADGGVYPADGVAESDLVDEVDDVGVGGEPVVVAAFEALAADVERGGVTADEGGALVDDGVVACFQEVVGGREAGGSGADYGYSHGGIMNVSRAVISPSPQPSPVKGEGAVGWHTELSAHLPTSVSTFYWLSLPGAGLRGRGVGGRRGPSTGRPGRG